MPAPQDSEPHERYWSVSDRLSPAGNRDLMRWVRDRSADVRGRFDPKPIAAFLNSDPDQWLALFTWYAFAEVPVGSEVAYALSKLPSRSPEACPMTLAHVIFEFGIPLAATEGGHKHFLCWSTQSRQPPLLLALPEHDTLRTLGEARGGGRVFLTSASDLPHVLNHLSSA